jgi:hypothetical protein
MFAFLAALTAVSALDVAAGIFDANETSKGIQAGVGVEGNEIITTLARTNKPSNLFLQVYNNVFIIGVAGLALFLTQHFPGQNLEYVAIGGSLAGLFADAAKHLQAGLQWRYMIGGGKLDFDGFPIPADGKEVAHSAWAKFIGPWIW